MLCDADIKLLEKRLCEKFSVIISKHISKDSIFNHLWCPLDKVTRSRIENSAVLVSVPYSDLAKVLELACAAQAAAPTTSFTFVVSQNQTTDELFAGWHLAAEWNQPWLWVTNSAGDMSQKRLGRKFRAWHAWALPPPLPADAQAPVLNAVPRSEGLNLCFAAQLNKAPGEILWDTGAYNDYIGEKFCRLNGIAFTAHPPEDLPLADDSSFAKKVGVATVTVRIQQWTARVKFDVINLNTTFAAIIGVPTNKKWKALIDMDRDIVTLRSKRGKPHTLYARPRRAKLMRKLQRGKLHPDPTPKQGKLMSIHGVEKSLRKGDPVFLGIITEKEGRPRSSSGHDQDPEWDLDDEGPGPSTFAEAPTAVRDVLQKFEGVFAPPPDGLPPDRDVGHTIPLEPGHAPPWRPLYRLSPAEKAEAEKQVKEYLAKGWIRKSQSPYGAPILFVKKKDGTLRMCIDYRAINKITVKNRYPLPRIDDLLDKLQGSKCFSSLDLSQGYHQIRITDEDIPKTAFNTHMGHYEFRVLSFGLTNAPATFQSVMNKIFGHLDFCLVYLDDILIFSQNEEEHRKHLEEVLSLVQKEKLYCKLSKCSFLQKELEYLGHIVSSDGIKVNPKKIEAVKAFPRPSNVSELRSFLGLANYFRKFIKDYARIAAPLTAQTGKNAHLNWCSKCECAFRTLKQRLSEAPVLALPDPSKTFVIESDASVEGIGAVLLQDGHPVAYESRKLSGAERNYTTTEQELLAVHHALHVWRCYLEGAKYPFLVRTDHNALTYLPTCPTLSRRMARWSEYLQRFHFQWEYKPGKTNSAADSLSRSPVAPDPSQGLALAMIRKRAEATARRSIKDGNYEILTPWKQQIRAGYFLDADFHPSSEKLAEWNLHYQDGFYWKGSRVAVPNAGNLRKEIFHAFHAPVMAGHFGTAKTGHNITQHYWWNNMTIDIRDWVKACELCQQNKASQKKPQGLLKPMPIPEGAWDSVGVDFVVSLPMTPRHKDAIMVVIGRLTKMAHFIPTRTDVTALEVADLFYKHVWCRHGLSLDIVSDRDPKFTSKVWKHLCEMWPMAKLMSTGFHPQTDGQTERMNRTLQQMLRNYVSPDQTDWDELLAPAEFAYNNAPSASTGFTPFFLNYGRHPRTPASLIFRRRGDGGEVPSVENFVELMDDCRKRARDALSAAQERQKFYADTNRSPKEFKVGQKVLLSTQNLKLRDAGARKLLPRYIGPFEIKGRVGELAYRLALPPKMRVHPVFHVSLLREFQEGGSYKPPPWSLIESDGTTEVERILAHRDSVRKTSTVREYLVLWAGASADDASWIPGTRVPPSLLHEYWRDRAPSPTDTSGSAQGPPLPAALRRSRRLLGLDTDDSDPPAPS